MKKILFIVIISILGIACSKSSNNKTKLPDPNAMQYRVDGLTNIVAERRSYTLYPLNFAYLSGRQERLHLSLSGLPPGVSYELTSKGGIPAFSTILRLEVAQNATLVNDGVITLTAKTESGESKDYDLPIKIKQQEYCLPSLNWQGYTASSNCFPTTYADIDYTQIPNQLEFDFPMFSYLYATVDCTTDSLYFVKKTFWNGDIFEGTGTFTDSTFDINYILTDTSGNKTKCKVHLSEQ